MFFLGGSFGFFWSVVVALRARGRVLRDDIEGGFCGGLSLWGGEALAGQGWGGRRGAQRAYSARRRRRLILPPLPHSPPFAFPPSNTKFNIKIRPHQRVHGGGGHQLPVRRQRRPPGPRARPLRAVLHRAHHLAGAQPVVAAAAGAGGGGSRGGGAPSFVLRCRPNPPNPLQPPSKPSPITLNPSKQDGVDREVGAVDSEHGKNLNTDAWRSHQLHKATANPGHPWARFSTGARARSLLRRFAALPLLFRGRGGRGAGGRGGRLRVLALRRAPPCALWAFFSGI